MFERESRADEPAERLAIDALAAGIAAAQPSTVLTSSLTLEDGTLRIESASYDLDDYDEVIVLGGGNAAGRVAAYLADLLGEHLSGGVVVTDDPAPAGPVEVIEGTHPIPGEDNLAGTQAILERARASCEGTLALIAITGGGSALLPAPAAEVSLADLKDLTDELLHSGAPINRINAVRKHVSAIKGGRLAHEIASADAVGLLFSDVTSGDPSVVASGPLSPDTTTYDDALAVIEEYDIDAPASVGDRLRAGASGRIEETPTAEDPAVEAVDIHVLADGFTALEAAAAVCANAGVDPLLLSASVRGEAREAAKTQVAIAEEIRRTGNPVEPPAVVLSGGETTVTIRGTGVGGPNQELALSAAIELPDEVVLGAVDTDGIDGPTDAAGALVTNETVADERAGRAALADNAAYEFLAERNALLVSGQTGTNVNDLRIVVVPDT